MNKKIKLLLLHVATVIVCIWYLATSILNINMPFIYDTSISWLTIGIAIGISCIALCIAIGFVIKDIHDMRKSLSKEKIEKKQQCSL